MPAQASQPPPFDFRLTARQRRLRTLAGVVLIAVLAMAVTGLTHPFFRSVGNVETRNLARMAYLQRRAGRQPAPEAERARRAVAVRLVIIGAYWTVCLILSAVLVVLAWMDIRELRRRFMQGQASALRRLVQTAEEHRAAETKHRDNTSR